MKYLQVFRATLESIFVYRLNFVMWRVRSIMKILTIYFFWLAIFLNTDEILGYNKQLMLTYVLGVSILAGLVLSSRSIDVGGQISTGELSNLLLKPLNYFRYWFFRDLADKLVNISCASVELFLIYIILKPVIFLPSNFNQILIFLIAAILGMLIYFYLSFLISLTTFWYVEHNGWPARFLFTVLVVFVAGVLFPLDIFPEKIFSFIKLLPTTYLLFFPLQLWLGRLSSLLVAQGIILSLFWIIVLKLLTKLLWDKGLKVYEAHGR